MASNTAPAPLDRQPSIQRWRPYRFLMFIYAGALATAGWEFAHRGRNVDLLLDPQHSFTDAVAELYPDNPGVHQLKTTQILLCAQALRQSTDPPAACEQFRDQDPVRAARGHFERGMRTGKHIEDLYYDYVRFLAGTGAPRRQVEAAYDNWHRNFPLSQRPDPRY